MAKFWALPLLWAGCLMSAPVGAQTTGSQQSGADRALPPGPCSNNAYKQVDTLVCYVSYPDLLASPEKFYGRKIFTYGYLLKNDQGALLFPFKGADTGTYEKIYIEPRPESQAYGMLNWSRSAARQGAMVGVVGTFARAGGSQRPALGQLDDVYWIELHPRDNPNWTNYIPELHLKQAPPARSRPPEIEIAPDAH